MNHREEPDEPGPKAPPPKVIRQSNSTPVEGSRPRWRPCQLNSQDEQGSGHHHHHHHHHYHRQSHQQQSGSNRAPPRRSRRNVPSHAQRRSSESGDAEPQPDQQPRTGGSRYRQVGVGGLQHRHRQQHKQIPAVLQPLSPTEINPDLATLSPEESSQELLTSSSQEDLTPQEVPTPSPQEVPHVEEQEGGSPGLHCSSSTESSLHTHSEETEDQHREREQTEECMGEIDKREVEGFQENREAEQEEQVEKNQVEKESMANTGNSKDSKKTSKRFGPIRVDVPPFSEFPRQPLPIPKFQTQPFKGFPMESKSGPNHLTSTSYTAMSTDMRPECPSDTQSYEETFSNSTTEACSTSYPSVFESCPKFYLVTPTESGRELFHSNSQTGRYQEHSEEEQSFEKNSDMSTSEAQINLHEEQRPRVSVGSRLHHYDEQSGDEASSPDRSRSKVWRHSEEQECSEIRKEQCEVQPCLPVLYKEEKPQQDCVEDRPQSMQESANLSGDAISLAIRDIKEAIEDVKTKMVRSPYTPDKPKEPVWVMRRDISPVEECGPQLPSPPSPPQLPSPPSTPQPTSPQNTVSVCLHNILHPHLILLFFTISWFCTALCQSCSQVLASDPTVPLGAESSRAHDHQEADISPSLPTAEEVNCCFFIWLYNTLSVYTPLC